MRMILLLSGLLLSFFCQAEKANPNYIYSWQITSRFKMTDVSPWKDLYLPSMRYMMMRAGHNDSDNTFCAIGYNLHDEPGQKYRETIIFWDKGQLIIRWQAEAFDLNHYTMKIRTMTESPFITYDAVLPRSELMMGRMSAYAKENVDAMRADCERNGEFITIKAFLIPEECKVDRVSFDCIEKLLEM